MLRGTPPNSADVTTDSSLVCSPRQAFLKSRTRPTWPDCGGWGRTDLRWTTTSWAAPYASTTRRGSSASRTCLRDWSTSSFTPCESVHGVRRRHACHVGTHSLPHTLLGGWIQAARRMAAVAAALSWLMCTDRARQALRSVAPPAGHETRRTE